MRNLDDVARARPLFQDAIALTSEAGPWRASLLIGLSATLQRLFSYTPVFLEDAELPRTLLEQAVVEAADDSEMSERANFLLACLIIRSRDRPDRRSLNRAVAMLTSIAEAGSALSANARVELAASLRIRDRPVDRVRVSAAYRVALPTLMDTNVVLAQTTAVEWGLWASRLRMWDEAAEAFRHALSAADAIYVANTAGSSDVLGRATGLAADAAFALAKAGQVAEAALVLETSRFRAGSEALALLQTDLDALAGSGGSELVARLERARAHWAHAVQVADTPSPAPSHVSMSFASAPMHDIVAGRTPISDEEPPTSPADRRAWLRRSHTARETRAELDAAISAVRQADGMSTFLADPQYADIVAVADRVPVLYLSAADQGGLAILVESGKAARVEFLPALTTAAVDGRVSAMRDDLDATARWLWTAAMARVLRMTPAGSLVLVPCGKLGLLPLHAAWTPDRRRRSGRRNVSDTLVIAYAPNARSVPAASHQRADTFLAVEDPAPLPAPLNPVSFAHEEVAAAAAWFPKAQVLANTAATPERVVPAICSSSVYHFACHGVVDIRNPRRSALILAGGAPLTVGQLLELQLERRPANGRLAVLFACDTAVAGSAVPDEVISLPAALLQAGLTGVVGTQWPVRGLPSALLSARFYLHVRQDGRDWATSLTLAQRWLRESTNAELAAFVHPRAGLSVSPVAARRAMWRDLAARDPTARGFADVADWGAYVYMGDPGPMLARTDQGAR
jgi:hypothetical protein